MSPTVSLNCVALHISLSSLSLCIYIYYIHRVGWGGALSLSNLLNGQGSAVFTVVDSIPCWQMGGVTFAKQHSLS